MASKPAETVPYLQRPLYVYDLPPELLQSLTPTSTKDSFQQSTTQKIGDEDHLERTLNEEGISTSTACALCKASFRDVSEQRQHMRSDLHRYNLKLKLKGLTPVDEATFVKQIGDLDESISGSDTSESESEDDSNRDVTLYSLLKSQAKLSGTEVHDSVVGKRVQGAGNAPLLWMTSSLLPNDIGLGIYRALMTNQEQQDASTSLVNIIKTKQVVPIRGKHSGNTTNAARGASKDPHFFLCMIGGGHFAAAIIGLAPEIRKGPGGVEERHAIVKAHKTFHRYTTRRKQGGSQSANDNSKGNAHSVGSSIRRANEAALVLDVRNVLAEWKDMIDSAELVFVRATGSQNRRTLFGPYDGQVLESRDSRVRGFPFSTRRATQNELIRAFQELTRLKVSNLVEIEEKPSEEALKPKVTPKPKPTTPKLTEEQETALLHTSQIQNLIRRSKAPGLLLYLNKNLLTPSFRFYPPDEGSNYHAPTPLHLAAASSMAAVVTSLLTKAKADPAIQNVDGKTPYDISGDQRTRDAFRIARYQLGEAACNWQGSHVPPGLSPQEAEAKAQRDQSESHAAEAERRKADLEKIKQEEEERKQGRIEKKAGVGKSLGGGLPDKSWTEKREEEMRGLSPEMQQRIERERRARAAEARFKNLQSGGN